MYDVGGVGGKIERGGGDGLSVSFIVSGLAATKLVVDFLTVIHLLLRVTRSSDCCHI